MLARFPKIQLAHLPTPLHRLESFGSKIGHESLFIKRDDLTGLATGGNKTRKLEFLLGEARRVDADVILTEGGVQSNHCRQTAAACAQLGWESVLVLNGDEPEVYQGNLLLGHMAGARMFFAGPVDGEARSRALHAEAERLEEAGRRPFVIPSGGSTPLGALGYFDATLEMIRQADAQGLEIRHVIVCGGGGGTAAGVVAAAALLGKPFVLHVIAIEERVAEMEQTIQELAAGALRLLDISPAVSPHDVFTLYDGYLGEGYGVPTAAGLKNIADLATAEGIFLDPVYTGKTMAGLVDLVARGIIPASEPAVFWHTGGTTSLFAWPELFQPRR
ncbi:MAG: D-cysteine desulfhydrase family protein [Thermaerobacterales bacterium]